MNHTHPEPERHDLRLIGDGLTNGGAFGKVRLTGDTEFNGSVDCRSFKCTGNVAVDGSLKADDLKMTGNMKVAGGLNVKQMNLTGELQVKENVAGEEIHIYGECKVDGGIQVERFLVKGAVRTEGMLNAERVELRMLGKSKIGEIAGSHIEIEPHKPGKWVPWLMRSGTPELEAGVIEGDVIRLNNVTADVVRGGEVFIGPGCRIRLVEYSKDYRQDDRSEVAESVKQTVR